MNFLTCKKPISKELRSQLLNIAMNVEFTQYINENGDTTNFNTYIFKDHELVKEITNNFPFKPTGMLFMKFPPFAIINKHKDDTHGGNRVSALTVALYPEYSNYAPIDYYDSLDNDAPIVESHYYTEFPVLINVGNIHGINNNSNHSRYSFQIVYAETLEDFLPFIE